MLYGALKGSVNAADDVRDEASLQRTLKAAADVLRRSGRTRVATTVEWPEGFRGQGAVVLTVVVAGLVSGAVLLLATVGFELLRRVEGFLNIAHPQLIVLSGFSAYGFNVLVGLHWIVSCVLAIVVTTMVGLVSARMIFWPMRQRPHYIPMIASVGLAFFLHAMIELFTGFGVKTLDVPLQKTISIGGVAVAGADQIAVIGTAAVGRRGIALLARQVVQRQGVASDVEQPGACADSGVNTSHLQYLTWAVASALAALAGTLIALTARIYPELGWDQVLVISAAAIIGGLGSIYGVMVAAVVVGLTSSLATLAIPSEYTQMVVFAVIALVVFVRPEGLFSGPKERVA